MDYAEHAKQYREKADESRERAACAQSRLAREAYLGIAESYDCKADDMELLAALHC